VLFCLRSTDNCEACQRNSPSETPSEIVAQEMTPISLINSRTALFQGKSRLMGWRRKTWCYHDAYHRESIGDDSSAEGNAWDIKGIEVTEQITLREVLDCMRSVMESDVGIVKCAGETKTQRMELSLDPFAHSGTTTIVLYIQSTKQYNNLCTYGGPFVTT
jgi:hypothetical protein